MVFIGIVFVSVRRFIGASKMYFMFSTSKIRSIDAREILDSRGNPTVACRVTLRSGATAEAKVPSGASTGRHEALELRDGGSRFDGKGVLKAIKHIHERLAPVLVGIDATRQQDIDHVMMELDGTEQKKQLGANAMLAVSLAVAQATAVHRRVSLWSSLRKTYQFSRAPRLPFATMNLLNGGAHAQGGMDVQECMIVPRQKTMRERVRCGAEVFHALARILAARGQATTVGDEGGFAPALSRVEDGFDLLIEAIEAAGYRPKQDVRLAADIASSELYDPKRRLYLFESERMTYTAQALAERYARWIDGYPFESLEDIFAEDEWASWQAFMKARGKACKIVGDDFLVTNVHRLERAIHEKSANTILIKFNQIGTLTEAVHAIERAHASGWEVSISHRSGETSDTTIADLAVAAGAMYIKTGSLSRSERVEKYNRLMEIERELGL